jgi:hypothetical protein
MRKYKKIYQKIFRRNLKIIGTRKVCWNALKITRKCLMKFKNIRIKI